MFTTEEDHELQEDAQTIAYHAILFSGVHETLNNNAEWDALSREWGAEIVALLSRKSTEILLEAEG